MRAAVHGNVAFVGWDVAYSTDQVRHPRASLPLFQQTLPQKLLNLAAQVRAMTGPGNQLSTSSSSRLLLSDSEDEDTDGDELGDLFFDALAPDESGANAGWGSFGGLSDCRGRPSESIRQERDRLRATPLPLECAPRTLFANHVDARHLCDGLMSHMLTSWLDQYPKYNYLRSQIPSPPEVLPLKPAQSIMRPLPVLYQDERTVIGNIKTIQEYIRHMGLDDNTLGDMVVPVSEDAYTFEKNVHAIHRREDDLDPKEPNLRRMQFVQPWPALFHAQVFSVKPR